MSSNAKILHFPSATAAQWLSPRDARIASQNFLSIPVKERSEDHRQRFLSSADTLLSICSELRKNRDRTPASVFENAVDIYQWIARPSCDLGLFDERDYFLGETALLAGGAGRHLGRREEAFLWLDRAEAGFRDTMNPAPGLANVAYARLALRFEMGRYGDVIELTPSLQDSFRKLRMPAEAAKCRLLLAVALKMTGRQKDAITILSSHPLDGLESELRVHILTELGDLRQIDGQVSEAMASFSEALSLLHDSEPSAARANLKYCVGQAYRTLGSLAEARDAFRSGQIDYSSLGMPGQVAYGHLLAAETLLQMNRAREAEWEILAALPAIDEIGMVEEGVAAVGLLRESVRQRNTNPVALRQLREHLEAKN